MSGLVGVGSGGVRWHFEVACHYFCHFERREKSRIGDCCRCNDFRFFTALRCVQNDRKGSCVAFRMTGGRRGCVRDGRGRRSCVRNDGMNMPVFGMAEFGPCHFE